MVNAQCSMGNTTKLLTGCGLYTGLCLVFLLDIPGPAWAVESAPRALGMAMVSVIGPALLLAWGIAAWKVFLFAVASIAICLLLARYLYRRFRDSEAFAFPLACAAAIWIASGWLAILIAI